MVTVTMLCRGTLWKGVTVKVQDLRARCATMIREGRTSTAEAVDKCLADEDVDDDAFVFLAREGLRYLVNRDLTASRGAQPDGVRGSDAGNGRAPRGKPQYSPDKSETGARWYWLSKQFHNCEGEEVPLLQFTTADFARTHTAYDAQARAARRKADFFERCRRELESRGEDARLKDLSVKKLTELEKVASSALGGDE